MFNILHMSNKQKKGLILLFLVFTYKNYNYCKIPKMTS